MLIEIPRHISVALASLQNTHAIINAELQKVVEAHNKFVQDLLPSGEVSKDYDVKTNDKGEAVALVKKPTPPVDGEKGKE